MSLFLSSVFLRVLLSVVSGFIVAGIVYFLFLLFTVFRRVDFHLGVVDGILVDKKVDEICRKASVIIEFNFKEKGLKPKEIERKKTESTCAIVSDVLMQQGLRPKDYNLPALVGIARYQLGLDVIQKGGDTNG